MAENMVRCVRCHEVFDSEAGPCMKCGTPYTPPASKPESYAGLYSDRYAATSVTSVEPVPVAPSSRRRSNTTYMIWGGVALICGAFVVAVLFALGMSGGPNSTPAPVHGVGGAPLATATLPPTISLTLQQLSDVNFSAHVSVQSRIQLSASVAAKAQVITIKYDGIVSAGNQWGTLKVNAATQDTMLVNGDGFTRTPPALKWSAVAFPPYRIISPLFGLKTTNDLAMVGQEKKDGVTLNHLRSTSWWTPDISRLSFTDLSALRIPPDVNVLDLWVKPDGTPVSATFSGTNMAGNTVLVGIQVQYTFSDVGLKQTIGAPGPGWTPSIDPLATPTPTPTLPASPAASPSK